MTENINTKALIEKLGLKPHPEGGFFAETYRSEETIPKNALPTRYFSDRSFSTSIYYLILPQSFSSMHRIDSDEIFHFYLGSPVKMVQLSGGKGKIVTIGNRLDLDQYPQVLVPKGTWQGLCLEKEEGFALLGCTVAPGFNFSGFELGKGEALLAKYPAFEEEIERLTRPIEV